MKRLLVFIGILVYSLFNNLQPVIAPYQPFVDGAYYRGGESNSSSIDWQKIYMSNYGVSAAAQESCDIALKFPDKDEIRNLPDSYGDAVFYLAGAEPVLQDESNLGFSEEIKSGQLIVCPVKNGVIITQPQQSVNGTAMTVQMGESGRLVITGLDCWYCDIDKLGDWKHKLQETNIKVSTGNILGRCTDKTEINFIYDGETLTPKEYYDIIGIR